MRLATRIDQVARQHVPARQAACAMCGGLGRVTVSVVNEAEPFPQPPGCPRCGEVYQIIIRRRDADST
jgi:hypothetical protein